MWCVENYVELVAAVLFAYLFGRMSWEEHRCFKQREEWRELCRLRERYEPGVNEEEQERKRLAYLKERLKV